MHKIIIIEQNEFLRKFLFDKLKLLGFEVILAKNGFDGLIKIKNENPDLVIMNSQLDRMSSIELLKEKSENKFISQIPVMILSGNTDRSMIEAIARFKIFKLITMPLKIDAFLNALNELFNLNLKIDLTPCIIDIHLNDDILFIEIADGLNMEKIEMLKYRIEQMRKIYTASFPKVLIIMSNIESTAELEDKVTKLMLLIQKETGAKLKGIKILSSSASIKKVIEEHEQYREIEIKADFTEAIDSLGKIDIFAYGQEIDNIKTELLSKPKALDQDQSFEVEFQFNSEVEEIEQVDEPEKGKRYSIAIVDDDLHILEFMATVLEETGWKIYTYESGNLFLEDINYHKPDLVFLDIMMPGVNGFDIIEYLQQNNISPEIVIVTALTQKDIVIKARNYGIKDYMTKPLSAEKIVLKAHELLDISL